MKATTVHYFFLKCLSLIVFTIGLNSTVAISQEISTLRTNPTTKSLYNIKKGIEIPFQYKNNFIIVDIVFDKKLALKFIFDTGAEHTVLLKKEITDFLRIPYERKIQILGSDLRKDLFAHLIRRINLQIGNIQVSNHSLLVLDDNYFNFENKIGSDIAGILGADLFKACRVKIDYQSKKITLLPSSKKEPKKHQKIPLEISENKLYIQTEVELADTTSTIPTKLMIDTGAGLSLLLYTNTHPDLKLPKNVLLGKVAQGLGGDLDGYLGRIKSLQLLGEKLKLFNVLTNYQEIHTHLDTTELNLRNGLIGNQILERFHVIIDYPRQQMWLRPNKKYKTNFEFDKSGLLLIAGGAQLTEYYVATVLPNSPAAEAGIIRGDRIMNVNGVSAHVLGLSSLTKKFRKKAGKKIKLILKRGSVKMKRHFVLRKLI